MINLSSLVFLLVISALAFAAQAKEVWMIDSHQEWYANTARQSNIELSEGLAIPTAENATFVSEIYTSKKKLSAESFVVEQSPIWENWEPAGNIGPSNLGDAPIFLQMGPDNYWMFGRYQKKEEGESNFVAESVEIEGFDIPLLTTEFSKQFDAPGGLEEGLGGYHAWQSRDMENWVHHGPVSEYFSRWMTTAEYVDGKAFLYYDFPNDQDPHLYVDEDLTDGTPGKNMGMVFKDPSHGSDCVFIRDLGGNFHVIAEDWSPINASTHAWDSPLATHAVSSSGIGEFEILPPAVDYRTTPTGEIATYDHPHWLKEDPNNYSTNVAEYEVHLPEQDAYGDWAAISIGGQYYLFCDFDPASGHTMSVGWFTSSDINKPFEWCSHIGEGHPDPDIIFAEGRFFLATQQEKDFVSDGPWVESVEARVGVDTDKDGVIDQWTDWQMMKEEYDYVQGFSKQVAKKPAELDVSELPKGYGFQFELKLTDTTDNKSKPLIDKVTLSFGK
ncbi:hypothetical protein MLD52_20805 [Puniceicoccaceae bacterium K14]|nr:hypothetical protein [Puniceicoccaceae bacterium K14]